MKLFWEKYGAEIVAVVYITFFTLAYFRLLPESMMRSWV